MTFLYPNQVTGRCKGGGLESSPPVHCGERNVLPKTHGTRGLRPAHGAKPGTIAPEKTGLQESYRLLKRKRAGMMICTDNARTFALEAAIEDLMMQARKFRQQSPRQHEYAEELQPRLQARSNFWSSRFLLKNSSLSSKPGRTARHQTVEVDVISKDGATLDYAAKA
ncbi:hypothetical protein RB195_018710 [Necator americanus]|uniref:Uncharacterized protein n=1 Tax=Necator americanus TaxID=51031 RepID=A0ABR1CAY7_NECAM